MGIIASSMALFVVLSVFSGLRDFSLSFTNATDPDLRIQPIQGKVLTLSPEIEKELQKSTIIADFSKTIEERVLFYYKEKEQVAYIKGVDSNFSKVTDIKRHLYAGNWLETQSNEVVVGSEISRKLNLGLFDFNNALEVYTPKAGKGAIDNIEDAFTIKKLAPTGIFSISEDIDNKYVFCDLSLAQNLLFFKPNQISFIEVKLNEGISEDQGITELNRIFKDQIKIKNRAQLNDALYKMLNSENIAVYLIFTLVIIIALFNLIGALIMMIIDKKNNLKTLLSLGCLKQELSRIFLYQGLLMTFSGGIIGLLLGILLVILQQQFSLIMITPNLAYPVVFEIQNIAIVIITITTLGYLASLIASRSISKFIK
ncbi:ABC transporter permease [Flavobacterium sediminis]|uniref:ABC transporter permease n=1 Tax=Flavobacterium sediminis TaxID=2201181 RepID=A0A2U8QYN9_9FLAO|nr:ABC transporter permease [Flavobacterium sediminis]